MPSTTRSTRQTSIALARETDVREKLLHHAYVTISNTHDHQHQQTCTKGTVGTIGCRLSYAAVHDRPATEIVDLRCTLPPEVKTKTTPVSSLEPFNVYLRSDENILAADLIDPRCKECYCRHRALTEEDRIRKLTDVVLVKKPRRKKVPDDDALDLTIIDGRGLLVLMKRPTLKDDALFNEITFAQDPTSWRSWFDKLNSDKENTICSDLTEEGHLTRLQIFRDVFKKETPCRLLLERPGYESTLAAVEAFETDEATSHVGLQSDLVRIFKNIFEPSIMCQNGLIADANIVMASTVSSNVNPLHLGSGVSARANTVYEAKYQSKPQVELTEAVTILHEAYVHIKAHPSTAEDVGTTERTLRHLVQRTMNASHIELEACQAADIVLGHNSFASSHDDAALDVHSVIAWLRDNRNYLDLESQKKIQDAASNSSTDEDSEDDDNVDDADAHNHDDDDDDAQQSTLVKKLLNEADDDDENDEAHLRGETSTHSSHNDNDEKKNYQNEDFGTTDTQGRPTYFATLYRKKDATTNKFTYFRVFEGETYGYRDRRLQDINLIEFKRGFKLRKQTVNDAAWYVAYKEAQKTAASDVIANKEAMEAIRQKKTSKKPLDDDDAADEGEMEERQRAGRPSWIYELRAPHPLAESHVLVLRAKNIVIDYVGAVPPNRTHTAAARRRFVAFYNIASRPWILEENASDDEARKPSFCARKFRSFKESVLQGAYLAGPNLLRDRPRDETTQDYFHFFVAMGRYYDMTHLMTIFKNLPEKTTNTAKYVRRSASTRWADLKAEDRPRHGHGPTKETEKDADVRREIARIRQRALRASEGADSNTRMAEIQKVCDALRCMACFFFFLCLSMLFRTTLALRTCHLFIFFENKWPNFNIERMSRQKN